MDEFNLEENQEIPNYIFPRLIDWMRSHGHTDTEIVECILYICKDGEEE